MRFKKFIYFRIEYYHTNKTYYFSNSTKSIPSEAILRYLINGREEQLKLFKEKKRIKSLTFGFYIIIHLYKTINISS